MGEYPDLPSRAAGPTPADRDQELEQLRRENAALRRLNAAIEEERLSPIRLAEARDRGPITTNDPRTRDIADAHINEETAP